MKIKADMSLFTQREIDYIRGDVGGLIKKDNPHYSKVRLYYYDIENGKDIIVTLDGSSVYMTYNLMVNQKVMRTKGFDLPYKTEWELITDPKEISTIQERESLVEL